MGYRLGAVTRKRGADFVGELVRLLRGFTTNGGTAFFPGDVCEIRRVWTGRASLKRCSDSARVGPISGYDFEIIQPTDGTTKPETGGAR